MRRIFIYDPQKTYFLAQFWTIIFSQKYTEWKNDLCRVSSVIFSQNLTLLFLEHISLFI